MHGFEHGSMGWGWPGMILLWLIAIVLLIGLVRLFVRRPDGEPRKSAREILDARYASGEIERDEYLKRHRDLTQ